MNLKRKTIVQLIAVAFATCLGGAAQAQTLLKLSHTDGQQGARHAGSLIFAKKVAEYTQNRYKLNVFCCGTLGNDTKNIEQVVNGGIDFTISGPGSFASQMETLNLTALPFLFDSYEQGWKFYDTSKWLKTQFDEGQAKGIRFLHTWEAGFRCMTTKDPLNSPEDAKGKKLRSLPSEMMRWLLEDIGFGVQILPMTGVYLAIQQGAVQGQENPIDTIYANKFYEVAPNITMTRHVYSPTPLVISEKTWQKLSPVDQKAITRAAEEAGTWNRNEVKTNEERQMAEMVSKGAKINRPNLQPFRDAVKPTYEKAKAKYGSDFDQIMAEAKGVRLALPANK